MMSKKNTLSDSLAPLTDYPQFILYRLSPSKTRPGKTDKLPVNPNTLKVANAHDQSIWCDYQTAVKRVEEAGPGYGIGFVFTEADPFFFIDIDNCLVDGRWSDIANTLMAALPGAAIEVSQSGQGLHIIAMTTPLLHGCKNAALGLEMYTKNRFVALTDLRTVGNAATDCTLALQPIIDRYFPPVAEVTSEDWRNVPVAEWSGPESDDELIARMLKSKSAATVFGNKASFNDLWTNNELALALAYPVLNTVDPYDRSSADMALAMHLAFWTGKNHERIRKLMWKSALIREKWTRNKTYLRRTIIKAVSKQADVYSAKTSTGIDSSYSEIMAQLNLMGKKLSTEQTTQICKLIANTALTVPEKSEITDQLKKRSSLSSKRNIELAINEQRYENIDDTNHPQLAQAVIAYLGKDDVFFSMSSFWIWKAGVWAKTDDMIIRQGVQNVCQDKLNGDFRKATIDSVIDLTTTELYISDHKFNDKKDVNIINVINGELHYISNKWALYEHVREHYFTTQLPVTYVQNAAAPRFELFLNEIFSGDPDLEDKKKVLLEMIGYSMLPTSRFEKFIMLIGNGANGKSVLLAIVEALIGEVNVCAVQPAKFDNTFQIAHLHNKLVNIITEIPVGALMADAHIKAIVSGEMITAEHKMKSPFDFHPVATCWFGTNHLPHLRDFSDAILRRAIILEFNNHFYEERCDPQLINKIILELPGIMNMALDAISGVLDRGSISTCESSEQAKRKWRLEADQVAQFIDEMCTSTQGTKIDVSTLYNVYKLWASNSGIKRTLNKKSFGQRLAGLGYPPGRGTKGVRQRCGLMLKTEIIPPNGNVTYIVEQ